MTLARSAGSNPDVPAAAGDGAGVIRCSGLVPGVYLWPESGDCCQIWASQETMRSDLIDVEVEAEFKIGQMRTLRPMPRRFGRR